MWRRPPLDLARLPTEPGVYRMCDDTGGVLYVGKARNLRRRVSSYFQRMPESPRTVAMVRQIAAIEFTVTASEAEALLLEHSLIQQLKPRYNVLLKDAKSYPWIVLTAEAFPRLLLHRGRRIEGEYFGPFPDVRAVRATIKLMQQLFRLRDCTAAAFRNRSRPCMQHQIGRCTAPCVGLVDATDYRAQVAEARRFLRGAADELIAGWQQEMERAAAALEFERAAELRDRIRMLRSVVEGARRDDLPADADAIAIVRHDGGAALAVGVRRSGRDLGVQLLRVRQGGEAEPLELLHALLLQRYRSEPPPPLVLIDGDETLLDPLGELLALLAPQRKRTLRIPRQGPLRAWLEQVTHSARQMVAAAGGGDAQAAFEAAAELLGLPEPPGLIAAVDNAHMGGSQMVSAIVCADRHGLRKELYRHYRLDGVPAGDDPAAMAAVLTRYARALDKEALPRPDLLLIDGGRAQLAAAGEALHRAGMDSIRLLAVSKGTSRKVGEERLWRGWLEEAPPLKPGRHHPGLLLIARVRDEAHRFAGRYLRKRRKQGMFASPLDAVPGVGKVLRARLLAHFGGIDGIKRASRRQLMEVKGVSERLAEAIFMALR
ncbi:MAG: excinuclease ABC subunit UvrC [Zetaproteobacteria bacterium]|nr:MAG: excinuclease ABC subunit UvrC [Zetaproteobacteria bacterium]